MTTHHLRTCWLLSYPNVKYRWFFIFVLNIAPLFPFQVNWVIEHWLCGRGLMNSSFPSYSHTLGRCVLSSGFKCHPGTFAQMLLWGPDLSSKLRAPKSKMSTQHFILSECPLLFIDFPTSWFKVALSLSCYMYGSTICHGLANWIGFKIQGILFKLFLPLRIISHLSFQLFKCTNIDFIPSVTSFFWPLIVSLMTNPASSFLHLLFCTI